MKKKPKELVRQIIELVSELAEQAGVELEGGVPKKIKASQRNKKELSGATGGLRILVEEGYFDNPRQLPEIIERLKQDGRHYSNATISMGLLNLVRERILTRFRDQGEKKWKYVIRK